MSIQHAHSSFGKPSSKLRGKPSLRKKRIVQYDDLQSVEVVNYKSVNYPDLCFLNFLAQDPNGTPMQKKLLKDLKKFIENPTWTFLNKNFENTNLHEKKIDTDRVLEIINRQSDKKVQDITKLLKYKSKEKRTFQLYIQQFNTKLCIFLIDLYHLGLPGNKHTERHTILNFDKEKIYNDNNTSNRTLCINEILQIEK